VILVEQLIKNGKKKKHIIIIDTLNSVILINQGHISAEEEIREYE
jgi:hypothetical protein